MAQRADRSVGKPNAFAPGAAAATSGLPQLPGYGPLAVPDSVPPAAGSMGTNPPAIQIDVLFFRESRRLPSSNKCMIAV